MTKLNITHEAASAAILAACDEGRLTQAKWHGRSDDGREIACLLGAIHPGVTSPAECNGALMPMWLAELTPVLFDGIAPDHIYPLARRYGELVGRWHVLSGSQWDGLLTRFLVRTIDAAVDAARPVSDGKPYWPAVVAACEQTKAALVSGKGLEAAEAAKAAAAAEAVAAAAAEAAKAAAAAEAEAAAAAARAWASASAAEAAASAAWAAAARAWAAEAAEAAAASAAWAAAAAWTEAAAKKAWATEAAKAAKAAAEAAAAKAYLFLFTFLLDQIKAELGR